MEIGKVFTDCVDVGQRHRALSNDKVSALAESMREIGLQQPISVWAPDSETCVLVAGYHRLEAAKRLGWEQIDCFFVALDEMDRELWEIDENLMRAELTPSQIASHLKRRKEIWEAKREAETGNTVSTLSDGGRGNKGFAQETAERTCVTKQAINKAISRAEKIPEPIRKQIEGTNLDTGSYMDSIKDLPPEDMAEKVTRDLRKASEPKQERPKVDRTRIERERLMQAWNAASEEVQQWFIREVLNEEAA